MESDHIHCLSCKRIPQPQPAPSPLWPNIVASSSKCNMSSHVSSSFLTACRSREHRNPGHSILRHFGTLWKAGRLQRTGTWTSQVYQKLGHAAALKEFVGDLVSLKLGNKRLPSGSLVRGGVSPAQTSPFIHSGTSVNSAPPTFHSLHHQKKRCVKHTSLANPSEERNGANENKHGV